MEQLVSYSVTTVILNATAILHYLNTLNLFIKMILDSRLVVWSVENIQKVVYLEETYTYGSP